MSRGAVLSLCDYTGNMVEPWRDAGYECICVDLQHEPGWNRGRDGITRVGADVREWVPPPREYALIACFPPCQHMAVSGARWMKDKGLAAIIEALELVEACRKICEENEAPYMIENPVSTLSTYWREPDHSFDPCDFGDPWTKRTNIWCGGGFVMPSSGPMPLFGVEGTRVEPTEGSKMHNVPPGPNQANIRSETPKGFARAVFEANQ